MPEKVSNTDYSLKWFQFEHFSSGVGQQNEKWTDSGAKKRWAVK